MRHRGWRQQGDARLDEFAMPDEPVRPHPHAVLADDELIESVVQERLRRPAWPGGRDPDERLAAMLAAWRADVGAGPVGPLLSRDAARAAVGRGRSQRRLRPLALAAALLVVVGVGLTTAAGTAQPGDPLWGLSRVVDGQRAASLTVALKAKSELSTARTALAQGRGDVAAAALAQVQADLPAVRAEEGREALAAEQRDLSTQVANALSAGAGTGSDPASAKPAPVGNPPPDVRAEQPHISSPATGSESPNSAPPQAAQQPSNPPLANPPSSSPSPETDAVPDPTENAPADGLPSARSSPADRPPTPAANVARQAPQQPTDHTAARHFLLKISVP